MRASSSKRDARVRAITSLTFQAHVYDVHADKAEEAGDFARMRELSRKAGEKYEWAAKQLERSDMAAAARVWSEAARAFRRGKSYARAEDAAARKDDCPKRGAA